MVLGGVRLELNGNIFLQGEVLDNNSIH